MDAHLIFLKKYSCVPAVLSLGTYDSYGKEFLCVKGDSDWENTDIKAVFNPPSCKPVEIRIGTDGMVEVPPEALAEKAGSGTIVFVGYQNGIRMISTNLRYYVDNHDNIDGLEPAEPTPDLVQQILNAANSAEKTANSVRADADAGKFDGPPGPPGDGQYEVLSNMDIQEILDLI